MIKATTAAATAIVTVTILATATLFLKPANAEKANRGTEEPKMKMTLNQVTLPSIDMPLSVTFFQEMGFTPIVSTEDYARFESIEGDTTFSLHKVDSAPSQEGIIVYFEVDSVADTVARLKSLGFQFEEETKDQSWLWTEAYLRDPTGNLICIYHAGENRKNPPWRIN